MRAPSRFSIAASAWPLAGHGALSARDELIEVAELLGAPIVKALLGKAAVPDDHPLSIAASVCWARVLATGLRGMRHAAHRRVHFPYVEYYPKPGQARGVQIDRDASRIGLRFPAEIGLVGDARKTLRILAARLKAHGDRSFLERAQANKREWQELLPRSLDNGSGRLTPGKLARELSQRLHDDAIVAWDSGHNTGVLARYVDARAGQLFAGSGLLATMACSVPYAIAAALAFPGRQVVAFTGDGGLSMLLGELATIVRYRLPIKIVVMKNNSLGQIKWEQLMFLGNREFECDLTPIDFAHGRSFRDQRVSHRFPRAPVVRHSNLRWLRRPALLGSDGGPVRTLLPASASTSSRTISKGARCRHARCAQIREALNESRRAQLT